MSRHRVNPRSGSPGPLQLLRPTSRHSIFREGLPLVVFAASMMLVAGAVLPNRDPATAVGQRPLASESAPAEPSPSADPTPTAEVTPPPTAEPAGDLATGAWAKTENLAAQDATSGDSFALFYGRLDGRTFRFRTSGLVRSARPADNGLVLGWWWDRDSAATVVDLFDSGNGKVTELLRTPSHIYSAAIAPSADDWYWIPSVERGQSEPPFGAGDGLWRQSLPGGTPTRVADVGIDPAEIQVGVDGSSVLISTAEPSTDFGPMHYRVWHRDDGKVSTLPTIDYSPVGLLGDELIVDGSWAQPTELFAIDLTDGSMRVVPTGGSFFTPGIFRAAPNGSPVLVYAGADENDHYSLFELRVGQDKPARIFTSSEAWPPTERAALLVRSGRWGGVNALGSAALFAFGSPYLSPQQDASGRDVPRLLVNLQDGTTLSAPSPDAAQEVNK